jgi:putative FmdB family regulatory protein
MPLYEYQCNACGHRFEVIQKFSDAPIAVCPECGGPVQKLLSSPAIQFKGSGFYLTDYGRGTGSKADAASKTGKADGATGGSGDGAKTDSATGDGAKTDAAKADSGAASKTSGDAKPAAKSD